MKREKLTEILRKTVAEAGYVFHIGSPHLMNGTVRVYPAAWLEPPALKSSEGRAEGEAVYRVALHMMALPSAAEKEPLWAGLEEDALAVARTAAGDKAVCGVSNVSCTPAERSLTAQGEVSVTLACDVRMWYII